MKILFFSPYFYPYFSGLVAFPLKILRHLTRKHQITVLTFAYSKNLKLIERINKITIVRIPYLLRISKGFFSPYSLFVFLKYVRYSEIVILNLPNFEGLFLALLAKIFKKKIIAIFHCEVNLGTDLKSRIINFFLNLSVYIQLLLSSLITVTSYDYANSLLVGKVFKNKIRAVLPPVEKLPIDKKKLEEFKKLKRHNLWLGFVGRIAKEKGLEYLIDSINNLIPQFAGKNLHLVFAGPYGKDVAGENQYYWYIKKMLEKYKISYHLFGQLANRNLGALYKAIDVLILPSINKTEAFGMVQAESMLLGTPVVASNLPGVRIPVKITHMGEIVEPRNAVQLSRAIKKILKNKNKYTNDVLVKKAQKIFAIQKTYKLYDNLISTTGRVSPLR